MSAELFLVAPTDLPAETLGPALKATFAEREVAALLLPRGTLAENAYKALVKSIAPIAQKVLGPVVGDGRWGEELGELQAAVAVGSDHHGDLDALVAQAGDTPGPLPFDPSAPFEREAQLREKRDGGIQRRHHDSNIVHPFHCHLRFSPLGACN